MSGCVRLLTIDCEPEDLSAVARELLRHGLVCRFTKHPAGRPWPESRASREIAAVLVRRRASAEALAAAAASAEPAAVVSPRPSSRVKPGRSGETPAAIAYLKPPAGIPVVQLFANLAESLACPGEGVRLTLGELPRLAMILLGAQRSPGRPAAAPVPKVTPRQGRILLADDDPESAFVVQAFLTRCGHEVTVVGDGAEAVLQFSRQRFDLVLLDLRMPGLDGWAAVRRIRECEQVRQRGHTPVVALSAHVDPETVERCRQAGYDGHLGKPVLQAQLVAAVNEYLAHGQSSGATVLPGGESCPAFLQELRPGYLAKRRQDAEQMRGLLASGDLEAVGFAGHRIAGSARNYGFPELTEIGLELEKAAERQDAATMQELLGKLEACLARG